MANQVGQTCILYRRTSGAWGTEAWGIIDNVENLKLGNSRTKAGASTRASIYNKYLPGQLDASLSFQMPRNPADADIIALRTAFLAGTTVEMAVASGAIATTGTRYIKMDMKVVKMDEDEPLDGACMTDVEMVVAADSTNEPTETTV